MDRTPEVPAYGRTPFVVPDWLSPARVMRLTNPVPRRWVIAPAVETVVLPPNPQRVGLLVIKDHAATAGAYLSPFGRAQECGIDLDAIGLYYSATLSDLTSQVCGAWSVFVVSGCILMVTEWVRP